MKPTTQQITARLPSIPNVHLALDETGRYSELTVIAARQLTAAEVALCHHSAGNIGAGIRFVVGSPIIAPTRHVQLSEIRKAMSAALHARPKNIAEYHRLGAEHRRILAEGC